MGDEEKYLNNDLTLKKNKTQYRKVEKLQVNPK
jgi:hypothetical protein